jgi:hypothetical protein
LSATLYNNNSLLDGTGDLQVRYFPSGVSNNIFENNIIYTNSQGLALSNGFPAPALTVNYNDYFSPNGNLHWQWKTVNYTSFTSYKTASGNDANSVAADPQFNSVGSIFYPLSTSPAVNHGTNLGGTVVGTLDLDLSPRVAGTAIDIGADEQ